MEQPGTRMSRVGFGLVLVALLAVLAGPIGCATTDGPETSPTVASVGSGSITVENDSQVVIYRVRFASVADDRWGSDRLGGSEVIEPGQRRTWEVAAGTYHVQIEFSDGSALEGLEEYTVPAGGRAVCAVFRSDPGHLTTGVLTVVNETGYAIARVYFSRTSQMSWGADRLGGKEVLATGKRRSWTVSPGKYNLKVAFQDGTNLEGTEPYEVAAGEEAVCRVGPP